MDAVTRRYRLLLSVRLVFVTQRVDPDDPVLGATVAKIAALAARVDEVVVLADSAVPGALPANCRVRPFAARSRAGRGLRFGRALSPSSRADRGPPRSSRTCARSTPCSPRRSRARSASGCSSGTPSGTGRRMLDAAARASNLVVCVDRAPSR